MNKLERDYEEYEADPRFGEADPTPEEREYESAKAEEVETRSYTVDSSVGVLVNRQEARKERSKKDKPFDSAVITKEGSVEDDA